MAEDNEVFIEDEAVILEDSEESDIDDLNASKIIPFIIEDYMVLMYSLQKQKSLEYLLR
jgi:hypothetical protein